MTALYCIRLHLANNEDCCGGKAYLYKSEVGHWTGPNILVVGQRPIEVHRLDPFAMSPLSIYL
jgi:hypothetical protein